VEASEKTAKEMVEWFGQYLDNWIRTFLRDNASADSKKWSFITAYNLLEAIQAIEIKPKSTTEALSLRSEIISGLSQVVLCCIFLAHTCGIDSSELILHGCCDFVGFQNERYGQTWIHQLRRWALDRLKEGPNTKGNHNKVLQQVKEK
jgi:hypothetical protein